MGKIRKHSLVNPAPRKAPLFRARMDVRKVYNFIFQKASSFIPHQIGAGFRTRCGVKLTIGFIFKEGDIFDHAKTILERRFGKIDFESQVLPFIHTDYYEKELGIDLKRKFISFKKLISPQGLAKIKINTNKIEERLSVHTCRLINIDPGYLDLSKLILASTKDHRHRIYLNKGIYAEVTLFYQDKTFKSWEWTYPDYKTSTYITIFNNIREIYARQIK